MTSAVAEPRPIRALRTPRFLAFLLITAAFISVLAWMPPLPQNPGYHRFADRRTWAGIPNAANVMSSVPLAVVGAAGLAAAAWHKGRARATIAVAFAGVLLTGIGSAYYHLQPSTERLFWDRLPLGFAAMALLTLALSWHISDRAHKLLLPLVICAAAAAGTWRFGGEPGRGDLTWWWGIVEIYPILAIMLLMVLFPASAPRTRTLFLVVVCFALAQVLDTFDVRILRATYESVSGHTLKHVAGAGAGVVLLLARHDW